MTTIRLIPNTYYLSSSSYLSVSNASDLYENTDSTTYATVTNSRTSTTSYYIYLRGFNFDDIPDGAIVNSFTVKFKAYESGVSTSSSYRPYLCNGTTTLTGTCSVVSSSVQTLSFSGVTADWETIVGYGSSFGIRINCRRASRSTTSYMYIYGAEIEVDYDLPIYHTLSIQDNGYAVSPTGDISILENGSQEIVVSETTLPTVTLDGVDITSEFTQQTLDTSFTGVPTGSSYSGISNGSSYIAYAVGYSAESPYSSTSSYYGSSSADVDTCYGQYTFDLSDIPSTATNINVACTVAGGAESSTYTHSSGGRYSVWGLCCNGTAKGEQIYTTSTSTTTITFEDTGSWTREELDGLQLRHYVGYYGGHTNGATLTITYTLEGGSTVYVYTVNIGTSDRVLIFSASSSSPELKVKSNGEWINVTTVYKKVNGVWVEQDISMFSEYTNGSILGYKN